MAALQNNLHRIHENLNAQLDGAESVFYIDHFSDGLVGADTGAAYADFFVPLSPLLDAGLTKKICMAAPFFGLTVSKWIIITVFAAAAGTGVFFVVRGMRKKKYTDEKKDR